MSKKQKTILIFLIIIGIFYFLIFIPPNSSSRLGGSPFSIFSNDEYITYPIVERMLTPGETINRTWANLIIYEDYHYGYPFYFLSMLVLLPVRLFLGNAFYQNQPMNILILRHLINVLPGIIAIGILVYVKTKFQNWYHSIPLFLFLLSIPSLVRSNIWWWHPDALTFLFISLTILFLDLDHYKLDRKFFVAAFFCGLAAATKLIGFFFVLTIPIYLILSYKKLTHPIKKIFDRAIIFVVIMFTVVIISNPFLFYETPRNEMIAIQSFKQTELKEGYTHDDPGPYQKGPSFWEWTVRTWFAPSTFIFFIIISSIFSLFFTQDLRTNILVTSWSYPFLIYTLFFVAPKPDHYIFPSLFPLFLYILDIPVFIFDKWKNLSSVLKIITASFSVFILVFVIYQFGLNLSKNIVLWQEYLIQNL